MLLSSLREVKAGDSEIGGISVRERGWLRGLIGLGESSWVARMRAFWIAMRSQETRPAGSWAGPRWGCTCGRGRGGVDRLHFFLELNLEFGGEYFVAGR